MTPATELEVRTLRRALDGARQDVAANGPAPTQRIPRSEARQFTERDPITLAVAEGHYWWHDIGNQYIENTAKSNETIGRALAAVGRVMVGEPPHRAHVPADCEPYRAEVDGPEFTVCRICQVIEL